MSGPRHSPAPHCTPPRPPALLFPTHSSPCIDGQGHHVQCCHHVQGHHVRPTCMPGLMYKACITCLGSAMLGLAFAPCLLMRLASLAAEPAGILRVTASRAEATTSGAARGSHERQRVTATARSRCLCRCLEEELRCRCSTTTICHHGLHHIQQSTRVLHEVHQGARQRFLGFRCGGTRGCLPPE